MGAPVRHKRPLTPLSTKHLGFAPEMALATDQQAMLKLLLERGQGYPELAVLLGIEEAQIRQRARRALTELGGADPDRVAGLTDYLLGQADPIDRADAVRHLRESPEDHRLAGEIAERLRELYPEAELPRLPGEPRQRRFARRLPTTPDGKSSEAGGLRRLGGLTPTQTRTIVILASAAVLVIAVVLAVSGAFTGDEDDPAAPTGTSATTTPAEGAEDLAVIELTPTSGGDASGQVTIGVATAGQPYADLAVEGLDPAGGEDAYVLWLLLSEKIGYPVSAVGVPANGQLSERYAIPAEVAAVAARTKFVDISLVSRRELQREIVKAAEAQNPVVPFTGESILRGTVSGSGVPADAGSAPTPGDAGAAPPPGG